MSTAESMAYPYSSSLVEHAGMDHLHQPMIVAIIHRYADEDGPLPGRPDSAARKAFATISDTACGESISALNLVIGRNRLTVSILWWIGFSRLAMGTAPPIA